MRLLVIIVGVLFMFLGARKFVDTITPPDGWRQIRIKDVSSDVSSTSRGLVLTLDDDTTITIECPLQINILMYTNGTYCTKNFPFEITQRLLSLVFLTGGCALVLFSGEITGEHYREQLWRAYHTFQMREVSKRMETEFSHNTVVNRNRIYSDLIDKILDFQEFSDYIKANPGSVVPGPIDYKIPEPS